MLSWETGVEFGRALEQLRHQGDQISTLETRVTAGEANHVDLRREVRTLREWVIRGALLAFLWTGAILGNLTAEQAGEFAGTTIKNLIKR